MRRILMAVAFVMVLVGSVAAQEGVCVQSVAGGTFTAEGFAHMVLPGTDGVVLERQAATAANVTVQWFETYRYANGQPAGPATQVNAAYTQIKRVACQFE